MRLLFAGVPCFPASVQMPSGKTPFSVHRLICFPQSRSDLRNEADKNLCSLQKAGEILHFSDTGRRMYPDICHRFFGNDRRHSSPSSFWRSMRQAQSAVHVLRLHRCASCALTDLICLGQNQTFLLRVPDSVSSNACLRLMHFQVGCRNRTSF